MKRIIFIIFITFISLNGNQENSVKTALSTLNNGLIELVKPVKISSMIAAFNNDSSVLTYQMIDEFEDVNNSILNPQDYFDYWQERLWLEYFIAQYSGLTPDALVQKIKQQDQADQEYVYFDVQRNFSFVDVLKQYNQHLQEYESNFSSNDIDAKMRYDLFVAEYSRLYGVYNALNSLNLILKLFDNQGNYRGKAAFTQAQADDYVNAITTLQNAYPNNSEVVQSYQAKKQMVFNAVGSKSSGNQQQDTKAAEELKQEIQQEKVAFEANQQLYKNQIKVQQVLDLIDQYIQLVDSPGVSIASFKAKLDDALSHSGF